MKRFLAESLLLDMGLLPTNKAVVTFVRQQSKLGRGVFIATGADESLASEAIKLFPEFDGFFASNGRVNLTSGHKAELLRSEFESSGFDYIGNSRADVTVWRAASVAYLGGRLAGKSKRRSWMRDLDLVDLADVPPVNMAIIWAKQLRYHQSLKNLLLFLPAIAAHQLANVDVLAHLLLAFVSFTLMASSVYLLNDLLDLSVDRLHATKKRRPIAAGKILPVNALVTALLLSTSSLVLALFIGLQFFLVLAIYALLTLTYSFFLKKVTLVDVVCLALLYMIRILAGAVVAGIELSFWFTGVTLFLFLSLALAKRYAEVMSAKSRGQNNRVPGRGYEIGDARVLMALGVASGLASVLLLAIYIQSSAVSVLYPLSSLLWLAIPVVFYWVGNLWIEAGRGRLHEDPVIFAMKNRASLASVAIVGLLFLLASSEALATLASQFMRTK